MVTVTVPPAGFQADGNRCDQRTHGRFDHGRAVGVPSRREPAGWRRRV